MRIDEAKMRELGSRMINARDELDYKDWLEVIQLTVESKVCIVEEFEFVCENRNNQWLLTMPKRRKGP